MSSKSNPLSHWATFPFLTVFEGMLFFFALSKPVCKTRSVCPQLLRGRQSTPHILHSQQCKVIRIWSLQVFILKVSPKPRSCCFFFFHSEMKICSFTQGETNCRNEALFIHWAWSLSCQRIVLGRMRVIKDSPCCNLCCLSLMSYPPFNLHGLTLIYIHIYIYIFIW